MNDQKILVTGAAGNIGFGICRFLAEANEVWGVARFSAAGGREKVESLGAVTRVVDLATGDYGDLPDDFTYVVHLAAFSGPGLDYDEAFRQNAESAGLLMAHCRSAKAFLHASTAAVYDLHPDPWHLFKESDPVGDSRQSYSPTYGISKLATEAVIRTMGRHLGLPTTIARINVAYDAHGGMPAFQLDWIRGGVPIPIADPGPTLFSPIHHEDMARQVEPLLHAASVPSTVVNWCGDEVVSEEEWCVFLAEVIGEEPNLTRAGPGLPSRASDATRRASLTGPCQIGWREGMRRMAEERSPDLAVRATTFLSDLTSG